MRDMDTTKTPARSSRLSWCTTDKSAAHSRRKVFAAVLVLASLAPVRPATAQIVEYYHLDALGSVRAITDQSGTVIERHDYLPFGEEWNPQPSIDSRKFTGKERDTETGFDYFGARYLSPTTARFTTVDPVFTWEENLTDPQRWNRYAYVRNNPLRFVDPDGRQLFLAPPPGFQQTLTRNAAIRDSIGAFFGTGQPDQSTVARLAGGAADLVLGTFFPRTLDESAASANAVIFGMATPMVARRPALLPTFSRSTIDVAVDTTRAAVGRTTAGARSLGKKLGHGLSQGYTSAFDGIAPTQANAEGLINDILSRPSSTAFGNRSIDAYNAAGQGVRIQARSGRFVGFLEATLRTR
jgi:RHS repeat-associated protein